jgi:general secretion pathway protein E
LPLPIPPIPPPFAPPKSCFGAPVEVAVASFEDITTLLDQRLEADDAGAGESARGPTQQSDDDIESLRDLASGAPVVRALNDLLERAVELRASDISH